MGTPAVSIVVNPPSPSPSSCEPVINHAPKPSPSSSSEPVNDVVSSPWSSPSAATFADGVAKFFFCAVGCKDKFDEVERVCNLNDDAAATDADACAKAVAALHKCVQARSTLYDGYARDADKLQ
jgi:hypothetical protein